MDNFLKMSFPFNEKVIKILEKTKHTKHITPFITPQDTPQVTPLITPQDTPQVEKLLKAINGEMIRTEIQEKLDLKDREYFRKKYLKPAIEKGIIEPTIPDKPNSKNQKYRLTKLGKKLKNQLKPTKARQQVAEPQNSNV